MLFQVEQGTWMQKIMNNVKSGVILKDVSMEVHSGEVLAILGSKGMSPFRKFSEMLIFSSQVAGKEHFSRLFRDGRRDQHEVKFC